MTDTETASVPGVRKTVLVVLAGAADPPGALTPLAEAETRALDAMARRGRVGVVTVAGRSPWEGFTSLLGLGGAAPSLGVASARGLGAEVPLGHAAYRADFVTIDDDGLADPFGGGVRDPEAAALLRAVDEAVPGVRLRRLGRHLNLAVIDGEPEPCRSPWEAVGQRPASLLPPQGPLRRVFDAAHAVLSEHDVNAVRLDLGENPANALWFHGGGTQPAPASTPAWLAGRVAILVGDGVETEGLASRLGCRATVSGPSDGELTAAALQALSEADIVIVRSTSVLDAGVTGDPVAKRDALSRVDARLVAPLLSALEEQDAFLLAVASDSVFETRTHRLVPGKLPFVLLTRDSQSDGEDRTFTERVCSQSGLPVPVDGFASLLAT